jgi:hypothetical protein
MDVFGFGFWLCNGIRMGIGIGIAIGAGEWLGEKRRDIHAQIDMPGPGEGEGDSEKDGGALIGGVDVPAAWD